MFDYLWSRLLDWRHRILATRCLQKNIRNRSTDYHTFYKLATETIMPPIISVYYWGLNNKSLHKILAMVVHGVEPNFHLQRPFFPMQVRCAANEVGTICFMTVSSSEEALCSAASGSKKAQLQDPRRMETTYWLSQYFPVLRSHIPNTAVVLYTSDIRQHDTGHS